MGTVLLEKIEFGKKRRDEYGLGIVQDIKLENTVIGCCYSISQGFFRSFRDRFQFCLPNTALDKTEKYRSGYEKSKSKGYSIVYTDTIEDFLLMWEFVYHNVLNYLQYSK